MRNARSASDKGAPQPRRGSCECGRGGRGGGQRRGAAPQGAAGAARPASPKGSSRGSAHTPPILNFLTLTLTQTPKMNFSFVSARTLHHQRAGQAVEDGYDGQDGKQVDAVQLRKRGVGEMTEGLGRGSAACQRGGWEARVLHHGTARSRPAGGRQGWGCCRTNAHSSCRRADWPPD